MDTTTLRDNFAAAALPVAWGMLRFVIEDVRNGIKQKRDLPPSLDAAAVARMAYSIADEMLVERERKRVPAASADAPKDTPK